MPTSILPNKRAYRLTEDIGRRTPTSREYLGAKCNTYGNKVTLRSFYIEIRSNIITLSTIVIRKYGNKVTLYYLPLHLIQSPQSHKKLVPDKYYFKEEIEEPGAKLRLWEAPGYQVGNKKTEIRLR